MAIPANQSLAMSVSASRIVPARIAAPTAVAGLAANVKASTLFAMRGCASVRDRLVGKPVAPPTRFAPIAWNVVTLPARTESAVRMVAAACAGSARAGIGSLAFLGPVFAKVLFALWRAVPTRKSVMGTVIAAMSSAMARSVEPTDAVVCAVFVSQARCV